VEGSHGACSSSLSVVAVDRGTGGETGRPCKESAPKILPQMFFDNNSNLFPAPRKDFASARRTSIK
jgi:hypothetical protein